MIKYLLTIVFLLIISFGYCQKAKPGNGYRIEMEVKNLPSGTKIYLEECNNTVFAAIDSAATDEAGKLVFEGQKKLENGVYSVSQANGDKVALGLFITDGQPQNFKIYYDVKKGVASFNVDGSPENELFADYSYTTYQLQEKGLALYQKLKQTSETQPQHDSLPVWEEQLYAVENQLMDQQKEVTETFPNSTLAFFFQSLETPQMPDISNLLSQTTNPDSLALAQYANFYKYHYFDNINFADPRLLRTPALVDLSNTYFQRTLNFDSKNLKEGCDILFNKAKVSRKVYEFIVRNRYDFFKATPLPELEQVANYIAEQYIVNDSSRWSDTAFVAEIKKIVKKAKLNPVGTKATDISMQSLDGKNFSLYDIDSPYTILFFYNPECEACAQIAAILSDMCIQHSTKGLKVIALYVDMDKANWQSYISDESNGWIHAWKPEAHETLEQTYDIHSIPMIYVLDNDKTVLYRDISINELDKVLNDLP